jgi:ADP-heptose:LPS heptosyltransferase
MASAPKPRVLVIRGGAIGDFILTLPAIRLLREGIPTASIEILGYQPIIELAVAAGLADTTRSLDHGSMAKLFVPNVSIEPTLLDYFRSFNVVVSYLFDPDGFFRGNMERIGVKTYLEASHRVVSGAGHAAEQLAKPLERIAMWLENPAPRLKVAAIDLEMPKPLVAVHPGSGSIKKNWPLEHWIRLPAAAKAVGLDVKFALVTGEAEAERGITAQIKEAWSGLDFEHWDQKPLTELASRLAACRAFIGHDSGISHLAAACDLPCLLLFGPTDPRTWAPRNAAVRVIEEPTGDLALLSFSRGWAEMEAFLREC